MPSGAADVIAATLRATGVCGVYGLLGTNLRDLDVE